MSINILTADDLHPLEQRVTALEGAPAGVPMAPQLAKVTGVQSGLQTKPIGPGWASVMWGQIDYDLFPVTINEARCFVRSSPGGPPNGNMVFTQPGIYNFRAQIYLAPPAIGANLSVYLGLFDIGSDGNGADSGDIVLPRHVVNMNNTGGMHPALRLNVDYKVDIPPAGQRYFAFRWYVLDGAGVATSAVLQTSGMYCFAFVERKA